MEVLEAVFKHEGMRPASISIDDFYLRFEDQQALAQVSCRQLAQTSRMLLRLPDNVVFQSDFVADIVLDLASWICHPGVSCPASVGSR